MAEPGSELVPYRGEVVLLPAASRHGYAGAMQTGPAFDETRKAMYVDAIRRGARRHAAAEAVGVSHTTVWRHMRQDEDFRAAVEAAEQARVDEVETALYEAAIQGNVVAQQVVLYNRRPDEWADQRLIRARIEAARAGEGEDAAERERAAIESLRERLDALRERLEPVPVGAPGPEPEDAPVDDGDDGDPDAA